MSVTIVLRKDFYEIEGTGSNIPLHRLTEQFSKSELMADCLSQVLIVETQRKLTELVSSPSFLSHAIRREDLVKYLKIKSEQRISDKFKLVLHEVKNMEHKLDQHMELFRVLLSKMEGLHNTMNQESEISLADVAQLFPSYKLATLRNKLSKNAYFEENETIKRSYLKIDGFHLPFRKPDGSKQWYADNIDFQTEKVKATDYDLQRRIQQRTKNS